MASIWSLPESKPTIVSLPWMPSSCTRVDDADGRALVGAVDALEVGVGRDDRLGDVGRLQRVATAVLDVHDLDVGLVLLHVVDEAVAPLHAGQAGLVVHDHGDLALVADQLGHVLGGLGGGRQVVGRRRWSPGRRCRRRSRRRSRGCSSSFACCMSGPAAWLSMAAKPTASGCLSRTRLSTGSAARRCPPPGALERDLDVELLAGLLGARFTACQNWCWKPLEMRATYGLSSPPPSLSSDAAAPAVASATCITAATAADSSRFL